MIDSILPILQILSCTTRSNLAASRQIWMSQTDNRKDVCCGGSRRGGYKNLIWSEVNKICLYFCWWLSEQQHFKLQIWRQLVFVCVCVPGANYDGGRRAGWGVCILVGGASFCVFGDTSHPTSVWHGSRANRIAVERTWRRGWLQSFDQQHPLTSINH